MSREPGGSLEIDNGTLRFTSVTDKAILVIQIRHIVQLIKCELRPVRRWGCLTLLLIAAVICSAIFGALLLVITTRPPDGAGKVQPKDAAGNPPVAGGDKGRVVDGEVRPNDAAGKPQHPVGVDEARRLLSQYKQFCEVALVSALAIAVVVVALKIVGAGLRVILRAAGWRTYGLIIRTVLGEVLALTSRKENDVLKLFEAIVQRMELEPTAALLAADQPPLPPFTMNFTGGLTLMDKQINNVGGNQVNVESGGQASNVSQRLAR